MIITMKSAVAALLVVSVAGCQQQSATRMDELVAKVEGLEKANSALEERVTDLKGRLDWLEQMDKLNAVKRESAEFDPQENRAYESIDAPTGRVLLVLDKVEPYLDGFTVHLRVGNPSSAAYAGMKGKVKWGRALDFKKNAEHNKLAEKEINLTDTLAAGAWTIVTFKIGPANADQVRRIIIEPQFNSVQMRGRG
jgi:hypothetical protein